jgi:hypothetical protein
MRNALGVFGLVCGVIVVWTVGSYGYGSSDDPNVKWNMAFLFGAIACGGLFGHAVSARLWRISQALSDHITGRKAGRMAARARSGQKKEPLWEERPSLRKQSSSSRREATNGGSSWMLDLPAITL